MDGLDGIRVVVGIEHLTVLINKIVRDVCLRIYSWEGPLVNRVGRLSHKRTLTKI